MTTHCRNRPSLALVLASAVLGLGLAAHAHDDPRWLEEPDEDSVFEEDPDANPLIDSEHQWSVHGGLGFGLDPASFALGTGIEYHLIHSLSMGPLLQLLVADDDRLLLGATANARYHWDLSQLDNDFLARLEPFVQGGLGIAHADRDDPERDDTDFLLNGGFGVDYRLNERLSLGTTLMFNGVPGQGGALGEHFFFSWQLLGLRYHF